MCRFEVGTLGPPMEDWGHRGGMRWHKTGLRCRTFRKDEKIV